VNSLRKSLLKISKNTYCRFYPNFEIPLQELSPRKKRGGTFYIS
jgi:hypothetical protein